MKILTCTAVLLCLAACGIKGDLVRPSEAQKSTQEKQQKRDGLFQLPQ